MSKPSLGWIVVVLVLSGCASANTTSAGTETTTPAAATAAVQHTKHDIIIARPLTRGQHLRVEVKAEENAKAVNVSDGAAEIEVAGLTGDRHVTLRGVVEVLGVDTRGQIVRARMTVEHFVNEDTQQAILPPGAQILAVREGDALAIQVNDATPAENVAPWLSLAFPVARPGGVLISDALGTSKPKAVGDTWEVSKSKVTEDMAAEGYNSTETNVEGEVTLAGEAECGIEQCLELRGKLTVDQVHVAQQWGLDAVKSGVVQGSARLLLPIDPTKPVFLEDGESTGTFLIDVRGEEDGSAAVQARLTVTRRRVASYSTMND